MSGGRRDGVLSPQAGPCANKKPTSVNCHTAVSGLSPRVRGKGAEGGVELSSPSREWRDPSRQTSEAERGRAPPPHLPPAPPESGLRCLSAGAGAPCRRW